MDENVAVNEELSLIFDKKYSCPICNQEFSAKQVKTGKARFLGTDQDLRPRYSGIDTIKYDVLLCPHCGYGAVSREFNNVTAKQRQNIAEQIGSRFQGMVMEEGIYTYDAALHRYKMALLTAMTKPAKLSECSYLCLKLAWLYRGAYEELESSGGDAAHIEKYKKGEEQYKKEAYAGFTDALQKEYPPICGMDETTVNYLMSVLAYECDACDDAQRYAYMVIGSRSASSKVKEKERELMEKIKTHR